MVLGPAVRVLHDFHCKNKHKMNPIPTYKLEVKKECVSVIGAGRLGICFALLCEESGHSLLVSDVVSKYVEQINNKEIFSNEPEVEELLMRSENLRATN